jgi:hypothetical protein
VDSIVDAIRKQDGQPDLKAISLRSRIGKGACQGTFCGVRVTAYLFDQGELTFDQCLAGLREFLGKRWYGQYPTLCNTPHFGINSWCNQSSWKPCIAVCLDWSFKSIGVQVSGVRRPLKGGFWCQCSGVRNTNLMTLKIIGFCIMSFFSDTRNLTPETLHNLRKEPSHR